MSGGDTCYARTRWLAVYFLEIHSSLRHWRLGTIFNSLRAVQRRVWVMRLRPAFRLLRVGPNGEPKTLFHSFHGSRTLPLDTTLRAVEREVCNPGKYTNGHTYLSGWHVLKTWKECEEYLARFTDFDDIVVARVWAACMRDKPRARSNIQLASYMKIKAVEWAEDKQTMRTVATRGAPARATSRA